MFTVSLSGPQLALELLGGLLQRAGVGAGRQVLPAAVAHDERAVGALAVVDALGDRQRRMQDRAGGDPGEDALVVDQVAGAA